MGVEWLTSYLIEYAVDHPLSLQNSTTVKKVAAVVFVSVGLISCLYGVHTLYNAPSFCAAGMDHELAIFKGVKYLVSSGLLFMISCALWENKRMF